MFPDRFRQDNRNDRNSDRFDREKRFNGKRNESGQNRFHREKRFNDNKEYDQNRFHREREFNGNKKEYDQNRFDQEKEFNGKKKESGQNRMSQKEMSKLKRGRIIIRNIPFGIDEKELSKEFIKFGDIHEVIIPKKDDGKQKGFAFINFKKTMYAIKAVKEMNGKQLSSNKYTRTIAVDFSMSKDKYINHMYGLKKIDVLNQEEAEKNKESIDNNLDNNINNQINLNDNNNESSSDDSSNESDDNELDDNELNNNELDDNQNIEQQNLDDENNDKKDLNDKKNLKRKNKFLNNDDIDDDETKRPKKQSNDIEEGKTMFIKNLSFETQQDDLAELFKQFGDLEYCIICMDKLTEHSKGTAFVKFKNKEDADKCVEKANSNDEESFYLDGRILNVQLAISKDKINVKKLENEKIKDKRNLYLSKEGLIYPDSPAAEGVSAEDLKKRLTLSQNKKIQLENLHHFVSKNRLCFHNLPSKYNDNDLRKLCLKVLKGEKDFEILFCKIMKNKDKITNKFTTSKGFGFVSFSTHKHALRVLRALNNNPTAFTNERRPIVEFTVEDINALRKNKQFIIKESLDLGLEDEHVDHKWAGYQTKPVGTEDKVINPITNKKMKDKKKKLQEIIKEQKAEKREDKFNKFRKESIKLKRKRIEESKLIKKKIKRKQQQDPNLEKEQKFLNKISNLKEDQNENKVNKSMKLIKKKKQKWFK